MAVPTWDSYDYTPPEYLATRAEQGYTQQEKYSMFEQSSIPTIMSLLQKQKQFDASQGASGISGGIADTSRQKFEDTQALSLQGIWQNIEDASLAAQERAMQQIYQLESQYKTAMMNRDIALAQMEQQDKQSKWQLGANIGMGLLGLIL